MVIKIKKSGMFENGKNIHDAVYALAQQSSHNAVAAGVADLTNNSGGSVGSVAPVTTVFANVADSSTSSAQKAATETALNTVKDALLELATKANAVATFLGLDTLTYNGGGTAADGTIGAVTVAVTAATTGVQAASMNSMKTVFNNAFYQVAARVNKLCEAVGVAPVTVTITGEYADTVAAITVDGGTAADPAVTKVAVDAALVIYRANVKTLGDKLVEIVNAGPTAAKIVAG